MKNKIILEIVTQCEKCPLREKCIEHDCVLFRIEKIITGDEYEKRINNKRYH